MKDESKTKAQLIGELEELRQQVGKFKAENALHDSEEKLRILFDSTHDLISLTDIHAKTIWANTAWKKVFGDDFDNLEEPFSSIHPEDLDKVASAWGAFSEDRGEIRNLEYRFRNDRGEYMMFESSAHKVMVGEETLIYVIAHDITERKQIEQALQASEELYRVTLSSISDAVFITDDTGAFYFICPNANTIFGYTYQEIQELENIASLLGESIIDPHGLQPFRELTNKEIDIVDKHGREHHLLVNVKQVKIKDGTLLYTCRDITERKQVEENLRVSEEQFRTLFSSSRDAIMILSPPSWNYTSGNPAAIELFGCRDEGDFTSRTPYELSPEYQPDGTLSSEKTMQMIRRAMEAGTHFFEWTHMKVDGTEFYATVLLTRMELRGKSLLQATVRDITEYKQMEHELIRTQRLRASGELSAGISHNLNNILTGVLMPAQFLKLKVDDPDRFQEIDEVITYGQRAKDLVHRLHMSVRGVEENKLEAVLVNEIIQEAILE